MLARRRRRRRAERGASAVEFALVVPILVALLLGILDYGIIFTDSVSVKNGVREAARQGVVSNFSTCAGSSSFQKLACQTKEEIDSLSGTTPLVKVYAPDGWVKGKPLIVCSVILDPGVINFVPTPADIQSKVELSIETATPAPTGGLTYADSGYTWPSGASSWC